jgi:ubiquinone/menaquinone biosynthesis C-methylase UbiE
VVSRLHACRTERLLQHLGDPQQALAELARVTRSGGRAAVLEFGLGMAVVDPPDPATTGWSLEDLARIS